MDLKHLDMIPKAYPWRGNSYYANNAADNNGIKYVYNASNEHAVIAEIWSILIILELVGWEKHYHTTKRIMPHIHVTLFVMSS